jgi:hypothetical protein
MTFDPWYFVYAQEVFEGTLKLNIPHVIINSEYFGTKTKYDYWKTINEIVKNSASH